MASLPNTPWTDIEDFRVAVDAPVSTDLMTDVVVDLNYLYSALGLIGEVRQYVGATAPTADWLLCNGAAISRTTYAALFAIIGVAFGAGDGLTTFNIPDFRGRAPIGVGTGSGLSARAMGAQVGDENLQAHDHEYYSSDAGGAESLPTWRNNSSDPNHTHQTSTEGTGSGGNMQPSLAINFIIRVS